MSKEEIKRAVDWCVEQRPADVDMGGGWDPDIVNLINVTPPGWEGDPGDRQGADGFAKEWSKRYPSYPVWVRVDAHDLGEYPTVVMHAEVFGRATNDTDAFPQGPENAAAMLADELSLGY